LFSKAYEIKIMDKIKSWEKGARRTESRGATSDSAVRDRAEGIEDGIVSSRVDTLSRIMKSEQEEKKHHLRLSKCQKVRFRKNRLWDKKQKNGPVIHIDPKDYQKSG
jgi:hypothetical protein